VRLPRAFEISRVWRPLHSPAGQPRYRRGTTPIPHGFVSVGTGIGTGE
jgi:hypothetical protein